MTAADPRLRAGGRGSVGGKSLRQDIEGRGVLGEGRSRTRMSEGGDERLVEIPGVVRERGRANAPWRD